MLKVDVVVGAVAMTVVGQDVVLLVVVVVVRFYLPPSRSPYPVVVAFLDWNGQHRWILRSHLDCAAVVGSKLRY